MNAKIMLFGVIIALVTAVGVAVITVIGMQYFSADKADDKKLFSDLFKSSAPHHVEFVEIKNVVLTLKGTDENERYLLLELSLATSDPKNVKIVEDMSPAIRGATVSLLSGMDYMAVREMSVGTLRDKLKAAYSEKFTSRKMPVPFDDVIISKMVFQ